MPPKQSVFAVTRRDFDHHTDGKGSFVLVDIHASVESANGAAKAHLAKEAAKAPHAEEIEECHNKDGGYEGDCRTFQDRRDRVEVSVKKFVLKGDAPTKTKATTKRSVPEVDEDLEDDDDDDDGPPPKKASKAAPKKPVKKDIPAGKPDALKGLKLIFTGTFEHMDRETSIATAHKYGAEVVKKLSEASFVIMGVKAGPKKIEEIEANDYPTMDEAEFLDFLKNPY